jgi:Putative transposase/Transposase zinc-binding domain
MKPPTSELAHILKEYKEDFLKHHRASSHTLRTLGAIEHCRTAYLGGHVDKCDNTACGHLRISYNSCRNRHCPKCQATNRERWITARQADLVPSTYYHVVFTIPSQLNGLCIQHPKAMYNILFAASKETVETFGRDPKHLGANVGMVSLLHTWGQNLSLHPHVHMIVPGGGFTDAGYWKNTKSEGKYLFPVKAMSIVYKNKFMEKLLSFCKEQKIEFDNDLRKKLYMLNWIVYAKEPFGGPEQVVEYIGRYSHKVAISNHRIKEVKDGKVTFTYKDYADGGRQKLMTLEAHEFIRRFCLHILPPKFVKIRHYGFLASRNKPALRAYQLKEGIVLQIKEKAKIRDGWKEITREKLGLQIEQCPCCKTGTMVRLLNFDANAPPMELLKKTNIKPKMQK